MYRYKCLEIVTEWTLYVLVSFLVKLYHANITNVKIWDCECDLLPLYSKTAGPILIYVSMVVNTH